MVKFVLANEEAASGFIEEANNWFNEPNQRMFVEYRGVAVSSIAEFLANKKGFTLYKENATYGVNEDE